MSRRGQPVPEAAPLVGLVLAFGIAGFGVLFGAAATRLAAVALALTVWYGFTAAVAVVPPALYHARYGDPVNPLTPGLTVVAIGVVAVAVAALGLFTGEGPLGLATAVSLLLAGFDYRRQRGGALSTRVRTRVVVGLFGGSVLSVLGGIAAGRPTLGLVAGGVCLALGAFFAVGR